MSAKKHKSTLVWIIIAVVLVAAFSQIKPFSMVVLPGADYRAYEWKWVVEFQNMLSNIGGQFPDWETPTRDAINSEWGKQTDENNQPIVIYSGPTVASYDWQTTQYQDRVRATFKVEVHLWFYGYFPNGLPDAIPLSSIERDIGKLSDILFPKVYAFPIAIAYIAIAICAVVGIAIIGTVFITIVNLLNERQRADYSEDWPPWMQFLYFVLQSVLGWFQTLGPFGIIAVCAVAAIFIWGGSGIGKKGSSGRRRR